MSSAAATACTCTPRCRLRRTAASVNSALYSWTFFGPARGTRHLPLLGGSVYQSEGGSAVSFKRLLGAMLFAGWKEARGPDKPSPSAQRHGTEFNTLNPAFAEQRDDAADGKYQRAENPYDERSGRSLNWPDNSAVP